MFEIAIAWLPRLFSAAALTILLAAVIFCLSGAFGILLAVIHRQAKSKFLPRTIESASGVFRVIPELVLLFLVFFGGAQVGFDLGPVGSSILAFTLVGAAYDFQVFKGALAAIPKGQFEAAGSLGLSVPRTYLLVILPQMLPIARKGWITYAIGTIKRLSIASAVSVSEVLYVTKQAIAATNAPFLFLSLAVALYAIMVTPLLVWNEWPAKARQ